jgi:hypothetical protein
VNKGTQIKILIKMKTNFNIQNKMTYILPSLLEEEKFCSVLNSKLETLNPCSDYLLEFLLFAYTSDSSADLQYAEYRTDIIYPQEYIDYWLKETSLPFVNSKRFPYSGYTTLFRDEFNAMELAAEEGAFCIQDHCLEIHEDLVDSLCITNQFEPTKLFIDPERPLLLVITKL